MKEEPGRNKELVLAPGTYAYMQDTTKGQVKCFTGPVVINQSAQEQPVVYNPKEGTFERVNYLEEAINKSPIAVEGYYLVLFNPAKDGQQPETGEASRIPPDLDVGRRINLPGPCMFPLWPGQHASYIRGHHLRSNQYLIVRVYNEDEARKNWTKAVVKVAVLEDSDDRDAPDPIVTAAVPEDLSVGRLFVIKGTEVSFYIPPTGITVVEAGTEVTSNARPDGYVRDALTLERIEYCILVDENGNKRYEQGPQVVFPRPTEKFLSRKGTIKSRAIELNEIQGIHVKVIADYKESDGTERKVGDELFIKGNDEGTSIYYPREEHSLISYDGKAKHYATAVPAGEARYVMNRMTGEIEMEKGPAMLLPDPRDKVIIRRVLSDNQCNLWYPNNREALDYNRTLRAVAEAAPTTRSGVVSEGDYERVTRTSGKKKGISKVQAYALSASGNNALMMDSSILGDGGGTVQGEEFTRSANYTQPRTITLQTKFQGVPALDVWTGYAVMVVSKTGQRHVEAGPKTILLGYDESLEVLTLSTGKPKNTDDLLRTIYLRIANNKVADVVQVETSDHVTVHIRVSYNTNFEGEPEKWWDIENYVKFLCDHARSVLKNAARKIKIADMYGQAEDFIRDTLLGAKQDNGSRTGMSFPENGMRVSDVEVLGVHIKDDRIQKLLDGHQHQVVRTNIELATASHNLDVQVKAESINRDQLKLKTETDRIRNELVVEKIAFDLTTALKGIQAEVARFDAKQGCNESEEANKNFLAASQQERTKKEAELQAGIRERKESINQAVLVANTQAVVERFNAAQGGFSEALLALSSNEVVAKVAESLSVQHFIGGKNFVDVITNVFAGSALEPVIGKITQRIVEANKAGNGDTTVRA